MQSERAKDVFLLALIGLTMTGCATMQSIEPVQMPPASESPQAKALKGS